jgi:glucokinase
MSAGACVVLDIGGTSLRGALYDPVADALTREVRRPTRSRFSAPDAPREQIRKELVEDVKEIVGSLAGERPAVVSVAFPGPVDPAGGVLAAPTVWGPREKEPFPLREALEGLWPGAAVAVMNDITAAGYRYLDDGSEDLCVVTVSSGIGHKVFLGGRPVVGIHGRGGEIGHWRVDASPEALLCECGGRGHLGAISSGRGVLAFARRRAYADPMGLLRSSLGPRCRHGVRDLDTYALAQAFREGDAWSRRLVADASEPLGRSLAGIHTALGIERFVVIGGFALALGEPYRRILVEAAQGGCWDLGQDWDQMIALGSDDDRSGLVGAGRYARASLLSH